jgi:hypothetical protein
MIKILINQLGRIRNAEIELKPFMVFTGDSGLGKSYTAFLVDHVLNVIAFNRMIYFVQNRIQTLGKENQGRGFSFKMKDLRVWMINDVSQYFSYLLGNEQFKCDVTYVFDYNDNELIQVTSEHQNNLNKISVNGKNFFFPEDYPQWDIMYAKALNHHFCSILLNTQELIPILFPPARAAFMGAKNALTSFNGIGMYAEFIKLNDNLSRIPSRKNPDEQFFESMMRRLTGGTIEIEEGQTYLRFSNDSRIPLSAAASSVKELSTLLRLLQVSNEIDKYSVLFEEPEAHVHPKSQDLVADLIVRCFNKGMKFQITTHSDYLLSRFNQLIRLGNLRRESPDRFERYCKFNKHNENLFLDHSKVNAYFFHANPDGTVSIQVQGVTDGIPFTTFHDIVAQQEHVDDQIETMQED